MTVFPGNFGLSYDQSAAQMALWAGAALSLSSSSSSSFVKINVIIIIIIPFVVIINTLGLPKNFSVLAAPLLISLDLRTVRPEFKQMLQV